MTPAEKIMREAAIPILAAEEALADPRHEVPDDAVYDLVLRATGSEVKAERAERKRVAERLRRNERPGV